jgi:L-asparagine transporter-like permease
VFVASLSAFGFLYAWLMIPLAQVLYRHQRGESYVRALHWRVPLYPLTPLVTIVAVLVAFAGQFFFGSGTTIGPITIPGSGLTMRTRVVGILWCCGRGNRVVSAPSRARCMCRTSRSTSIR